MADQTGNEFPWLDDSDSALYNAAYYAGAEVLLVAAGGEIVAAGEYATDISAEDIESVLP